MLLKNKREAVEIIELLEPLKEWLFGQVNDWPQHQQWAALAFCQSYLETLAGVCSDQESLRACREYWDQMMADSSVDSRFRVERN